jgi:hypothetical protein
VLLHPTSQPDGQRKSATLARERFTYTPPHTAETDSNARHEWNCQLVPGPSLLRCHRPDTAQPTCTVLLVSLMNCWSRSDISLAILSTRPCTIFSLQRQQRAGERQGMGVSVRLSGWGLMVEWFRGQQACRYR